MIPNFGSSLKHGQLNMLLQDQLAAMGDFLTTDVGSLNWIECLVNARALYAAYQFIALLSNQLNPAQASIFLDRWAKIYNVAGLNDATDITNYIELKQSEFGQPPNLTNLISFFQQQLGSIFIDIEVAPELQPFATTDPTVQISEDGYTYSSPLSRVFVYVWQPRDNQDNLLMPNSIFNATVDSYHSIIESWNSAYITFITMNLTNRGFQDGYADGYNGLNFNNYLDGYNVVSGTAGDNHLVGTGTAFFLYPNGDKGDFVEALDGGFNPPIQIVDDSNTLQTYFVLSVQNNTHLTLTTPLVNNVTMRTYRTLGCVMDTPGMMDSGQLLNNGFII